MEDDLLPLLPGEWDYRPLQPTQPVLYNADGNTQFLCVLGKHSNN